MLKNLSTSILFLALSLFFSASFAKVTNELQSWTFVAVNKDLSSNWALYFELQNRLRDHLSNEGVFIIRPAIYYKVNKNLSLWQGYAWTPSFNDSGMLDEHRLWQQILYKKNFSKLETSAWLRLEERFIENTDSVAIRPRFRFNFKLPLFKLKTWKLVAFDEVFFNINTVRNGPEAGFDQNRNFIGIEKNFNESINLSIGYLINYLNRDVNQLQHAIFIQSNINL